jgi:hypothetical protein
MKRVTAVLAAPAAMAILLVPATASAAPATTALPCSASMSNSRPADYTTTDVRVRTAAHAGVTTVAHYKTVNREHTGKANAKGQATIYYYISGATPGYKVVVSVRVTLGSRSGNCSTSFIPHR